MCGICGIVGKNSDFYDSRINNMIASIKHRGPDGDGIVKFDDVILGHTRLSIVDLECGNQPMYNADKSIAITFNGEIYGFRDIKASLDYSFKTKSDTEVILVLYEKYGLSLFDHLPGMFSFALWDNNNKTLICARDRFGEKPFFYSTSTDSNEFVFASEIKSILAAQLEKPKLSKQAITQYLQLGYTGPDFTIYENIRSLPPSHFLTYKNGNISIKRYWNFPEVNRSITYKEAEDIFYEKLQKAINSQLIADVDVGSFLSGGLDSSSIVTFASKFHPNIKTYSFGFKNKYDELPVAAETAKLNKTNHHAIRVDDINITDIILKLPEMYDEPFADSSSIPTYIICKKAREFNKVVLGGEGGDELIGGYTWWFNDLVLMNQLKGSSAINKILVTGNAGIEKMLSISGMSNSTVWRNKRYLVKCNGKYESLLHKFLLTGLRYQNNDFRSLDLPAYNTNIPELVNKNEEVNSVFQYIIQNSMAADILVKTDRAAMINSLELRSPLLDIEFASFCMSLPPEFKISTKESKIIFRDVMKSELSESVLSKQKQGFGAPDNWETNPSVISMKNEFLNDPSKKIFNYLPYKEVNNIIKTKNNFWEFLVLSVWFEKFYPLL
jgi:asparagine synthase (glutamine-hydrolysing)